MRRPVPLEHNLYYSGELYTIFSSRDVFLTEGVRKAQAAHKAKNAPPTSATGAKALPTGRPQAQVGGLYIGHLVVLIIYAQTAVLAHKAKNAPPSSATVAKALPTGRPQAQVRGNFNNHATILAHCQTPLAHEVKAIRRAQRQSIAIHLAAWFSSCVSVTRRAAIAGTQRGRARRRRWWRRPGRRCWWFPSVQTLQWGHCPPAGGRRNAFRLAPCI